MLKTWLIYDYTSVSTKNKNNKNYIGVLAKKMGENPTQIERRFWSISLPIEKIYRKMGKDTIDGNTLTLTCDYKPYWTGVSATEQDQHNKE